MPWANASGFTGFAGIAASEPAGYRLHQKGFAVDVFEVQRPLRLQVPLGKLRTPVIEHVLVLRAVPDMLLYERFEQLGDMAGIFAIALQALKVAETSRLGFATQRIPLLAWRYRKLADLDEITDCSLVHVPDLIVMSWFAGPV